MRWVLIRPLNISSYYDPETQEPLGLEYISAVLKKNKQEVLILDSSIENISEIKLARRVISFEPDVIGFSITTSKEINSVLTIYHECVKLVSKREIKWIAGGNYVTIDTSNSWSILPKHFYLIKFEGEIAVQNLLSDWSENKISTYKLNNIIEGSVVENLDELPFPERPYYQYLLNFGWAFNMQGSRGCCSSCKYCASSGMRNKANKNWRARSPWHIVKEIRHLNEKFNAQIFNFIDEDFLGTSLNALERAKKFYEEIQRNKLNISFGIQIRPNSLSEEIIEYLVNAGLRYVFMGIESDNPDDFKRWGRAYCKDVWRWVGVLQKKGVEVNAGTLLFHPDCSFTGIRDFATLLRKYQLFNYRTATNRLDAMPGSSFYKKFILSHKNKDLKSGIISLPFINPEMENFYQDINKALYPIEAPSMHAICCLPPIQTCRKDTETAKLKYCQLKDIIDKCDERVTNCFFSILEMYENHTYSENTINDLKNENIKFSKTITNDLIEKGFVRSPEMLYKAISYES